jgi:hypothetical protein
MERYCSTGQSPQRAVAPTEEEEEEELKHEAFGNTNALLFLNYRVMTANNDAQDKHLQSFCIKPENSRAY